MMTGRYRMSLVSKKCCICDKDVSPHSRYCARHRKKFFNTINSDGRTTAGRDAWSEKDDGFICHYTGVKLNEDDPNDAWYVNFDHPVPGQPGKVVMCARWYNLLKTDLVHDELQTAVRGANTFHLTGVPLDPATLKCGHWVRAVRPKISGPKGKSGRPENECPACGAGIGHMARYCARCRKFIMNHSDRAARIDAMKAAWDGERNGFVCHYSGILLDDKDHHSPFYLTFDHTVPGENGKIVVAAYLFNEMKDALSEEEFWAVVKELVRMWDELTPFDKSVVKFEFMDRKA
jgi:hypothetical protein